VAGKGKVLRLPDRVSGDIILPAAYASAAYPNDA
jgi:hypothetical protein